MNKVYLFDDTHNIPDYTKDFLCNIADVFEMHRKKCLQEFFPGIDLISKILKNQVPLQPAILKADDNKIGQFTIEIQNPWEIDKLTLFAKKMQLDPWNNMDKNPGNMFLWGPNGMRRRGSKDFGSALVIINSVVKNGGIYAALPNQNKS